MRARVTRAEPSERAREALPRTHARARVDECRNRPSAERFVCSLVGENGAAVRRWLFAIRPRRLPPLPGRPLSPHRVPFAKHVPNLEQRRRANPTDIPARRAGSDSFSRVFPYSCLRSMGRVLEPSRAYSRGLNERKKPARAAESSETGIASSLNRTPGE